jgi:hypothetical protein
MMDTNCKYFVRFEVLSKLKVKTDDVCGVTPCRLAELQLYSMEILLTPSGQMTK